MRDYTKYKNRPQARELSRWRIFACVLLVNLGGVSSTIVLVGYKEKEIDLIQDGGKIKRQKDIHLLYIVMLVIFQVCSVFHTSVLVFFDDFQVCRRKGPKPSRFVSKRSLSVWEFLNNLWGLVTE